MTLDSLIRLAKEQGASDIHLEGGLPMALRVRGVLRLAGEPVAAAALTSLAREVVGDDGWDDFLERRSADVSRTVQGLRCRINVLRTARGVGFAIRLLSAFGATLKKLNLHPELRRLVQPTHGLVLVTGPTGSGKTSTLAALLQELNLAEARHIITVESPIEYMLVPKLSFIRQREVGRDTPSFAQALIDALREDPDVLMVGEMREPEVMKLTLNAAETGHLVMATVHSSTPAEALQRIVAAFPPEIQAGVCAQLADCLVGVVAQRLRYREDLRLRVPECEILMTSTGVKAIIRQGHFYKLASAIESGAADGSWSFSRYGEWLARKTDWAMPAQSDEPVPPAPEPDVVPQLDRPRPPRPSSLARPRPRPAPTQMPQRDEDGVLVIADGDDPEAILRELEGHGER
ncbi:MAG TPA: ATPase, T2SS/T4P/T4SS family [Myxococcaceae bacterium]|nr:ATPase, T2SS/T4P/T4SS family [Myxococcaceae bacterium]